MPSGRLAPLKSIQRIRQIAVEEAQRALADASRAREASTRVLDDLTTQLHGLQEQERMILSSGAALDIDSLGAARRYRHWLMHEVDAARKSLERAERAESDARAQLGNCLRARNAVGRLLERRELEVRAQAALRAQHIMDDQGALRLLRSTQTTGNPRGVRHGH
jgi:flagellar export protein FliJ